MNRSLNNAAEGKLMLDIDADDLQRVIDGNFNKQQINAFTQSFEQEARFLTKADKFTAQYAETGEGHFLDKASSMEQKGALQKAKFDARIERFSGQPIAEAKSQAKKTAKEAAQAAAKDSAKTVAKGEAKKAAKAAAKDVAKETAKNAAKKAAKENAKKAAKHS